MSEFQVQWLKEGQVFQTYSLDKEIYTIGRSPDSDIVLEHPKVSRLHAKFVKQGDAYLVRDMNSTNYVFVNGVRVKDKLLKDQDKVQISSDLTLQFTQTVKSNTLSPFASTQLDLRRDFIHKDDLIRLQEVVLSLDALQPLDTVLNRVLQEAIQIIKAQRGFIVLMGPSGKILWELAQTHRFHKDESSNQPKALPHEILEHTCKAQSLVTSQIELEVSEGKEVLMDLMCIPLLFQEKQIGLFYLDSQPEQHSFSDSDQYLFQFLGNLAVISILNSRRFAAQVKENEKLKQVSQNLKVKLEGQGTSLSQIQDHSYSAGGVVISASHRVLIVKQYNQTWSLPKGKIEVGEEAAVAAMREIYEESGVGYLQMVKQLPSYERTGLGADGKEEPTIKKTIYMYLFKAKEIPLSPRDGETNEARWSSFSDALKLLSHDDDKAYLKNQLQGLLTKA